MRVDLQKTLEIESSDSYTFDALRGVQAGREFYVAMCHLRIIPKLFTFNEEDMSPEFRAQRTLREARIPEIAHYIVNNLDSYIFSSLTASVDGALRFFPDPSVGSKGKIGKLNIAIDARLLINDGQHRRKAIELALKQKPEIGNEMISVVFFSDRGLKRSQQMFADLNKHAVKPTKSLSILYDHRDDLAQFIVKIANELEIFRNRTEFERTAISNRSTKFFTLNGISDATRHLLSLSAKKSSISEEQKKIAVEFWDEVAKNIPEWQLLIEKKVSPHELRQEYVHSHTNLLNTLGMVGNILIKIYPNDWKQKLKKLQKIDWSRSSPNWEGRLVIRGKMIKNRIGIQLAANTILKECLGKIPPERKEYEGIKVAK